MTEKLYESNAYCKTFQAVVEECRPMNGKYGVVLNQTAFFPEGGGQAADQGTINGHAVLDVQQKDAVILHMLETELQPGEEVSCEIDWAVRYARMQAHTGEHILSGVVHALYGYNNVGFHMNDKLMVVDFDGSLSLEDIQKIEIRANEAVYANADVLAYYPTAEELEKLEYRSKKELSEAVRIVKIGEDIDCCACCAPHVARTGEIGIIKVLDFCSYKQGTRIEMAAGKNALLDYMSMNLAMKELMKLLSVPKDGVVDAVREKNTAYQTLNFEYQKQAKQLALHELQLVEKGDSVYALATELSFDELRYCANQLADGQYNVCLLLSGNSTDGYIYVVSSKETDVRDLVKQLNDSFSGKGGGQKNYAQGKIQACAENEIKGFVENLLENALNS